MSCRCAKLLLGVRICEFPAILSRITNNFFMLTRLAVVLQLSLTSEAGCFKRLARLLSISVLGRLTELLGGLGWLGRIKSAPVTLIHVVPIML